jgi:hypothetical protein
MRFLRLAVTAVAYLVIALAGSACGARTGLFSPTDSSPADSGVQAESGSKCTPRCGTGQSCEDGMCVCDSSCLGCCSGNSCLPGNSSAACGIGGRACSACAATSQTCAAGECVTGLDTGVLLFGGENDNEVLGDTWIWNGASWAQQTGPEPSARGGAGMATLDGTIVLFGGFPSAGVITGDSSPPYAVLGDTWTWDGAWTKQRVTGPSPRGYVAMATLNGVVVLSGGIDQNGNDLDDTWTWDGTTWTQEHVTGPHVGSAGMAPIGASIVLFGGVCCGLGTPDAFFYQSDTWVWDGAQWTKQKVTGPSARALAPMAALSGTVVLFGGSTSSGITGDTWTWDSARWTQEGVRGPEARQASGMATMNGTVVLFGGSEVTPDGLDDTWTWDGASWTKQNVTGPSARISAAMATLATP